MSSAAVYSPFTLHGEKTFELRSPRITESIDGPDRVVLYWQSNRRNTFKVGTAPPNFPHMRIVEHEPMTEYEDQAYEHVLQCEGFVEDKLFVETDLSESSPEEGWDEVHRSIFTQEPDHEWFLKGQQIIDAYTGQVVPGYEFVWMMDRDKRKHRARDYFDVSMVFRGILGNKPAKRRMNTTPQTVSPGKFEGVTLAAFDTWAGYPPRDMGGILLSGSDLDLEWDIPQISITDVFLTLTKPPTDKVPAFWTPDGPPIVITLPVFAAEYTIHVPYGWKVLAMQSEQLAGKECWLLSITWGYQAGATPKG